MATTFQTIPTMDPSESAFVVTVDDNLVKPSNIPVVGTKWRDWALGQRDRDIDQEWRDYVFVDTADAAPGRRAFVFGKLKTAAEALVPFESYTDNEFWRWPTVVKQMYKLGIVSVFNASNSVTSSLTALRQFSIKPAAEVESVIKVERFQNAVPWSDAQMRHRKPITDDLGTAVRDCLHNDIVLTSETSIGSQQVNLWYDPQLGMQVVMFYPATNFTDWAPFVLRDSQKQVNGMWVREKVTIYPPIHGNQGGRPKVGQVI